MDREAWQATVHGVAKSRTQLSHSTAATSKFLVQRHLRTWRERADSPYSRRILEACLLYHDLIGIIKKLLYLDGPVMEKAIAPHSSTLAWDIPWTEEPGRLQSMGSLRVGHDWAASLSLFTFMHWRKKWQPTPVFLPGESQGQESLVGCRLWGRTESDTTDVT